ncbi:uncharacterized protein LJ206_016287 isoform 2-T2 [Theristicus caerulescens]
MEQINYSLIFISQNRSRSPGKRWGIAVNPSNRRRENCTFLHVLQVLVPSDRRKPPQNQPAHVSWQDQGLRHHKLFLFGIKILRCCRKFGLEQILSALHRTANMICSGDLETPGMGSSIWSDGMGQSVARELSAMLFQFRGSCNRKDQLLENPWKALGESHGRKTSSGGSSLSLQPLKM